MRNGQQNNVEHAAPADDLEVGLGGVGEPVKLGLAAVVEWGPWRRRLACTVKQDGIAHSTQPQRMGTAHGHVHRNSMQSQHANAVTAQSLAPPLGRMARRVPRRERALRRMTHR